MKIFITGANGMLGTATRDLLDERRIDYLATDIVNNDHVKLVDIRDISALKNEIEDYQPDYVFHYAAETNVDYCEQDIDHSFRTNSLGTENVVKICSENNIPIVYISTGSVFDGKKREPYTEYDEPNPLNYYAKAKFEGERIVQSFLKKYYIIRAGWMIGGGKKDKKFVAKMLELMEKNDEIKVVSDKIGTPCFTFDFAVGILNIITNDNINYGLYHLVNKGITTRLEIAEEIKKIKNFNTKITQVPSSFFPLPAARPDSEALINYKLELLRLNLMPHWKDSLRIYLKRLEDKS